MLFNNLGQKITDKLAKLSKICFFCKICFKHKHQNLLFGWSAGYSSASNLIISGIFSKFLSFLSLKLFGNLWGSLLNRVPCDCLRANVVHVTTYFCASVLYLPTCLRTNVSKACHCALRCASVSIWRAKVPKGKPIFQRFFILRNAKGKFYNLLLCKKFCIILDIIVIHMICICIKHINCIILHFYTSCHIKEKWVEFFFFLFFSFCSLVRNKNVKRPGFYTSHVTRFFSNFP